MEKINQFNMACDFSFEKSAEKYLSLYRQVEKE
jgi:glycogen synthase